MYIKCCIYSNFPFFKLCRVVSRSTIQVKTHAQVVLKRLQGGEDVFAELDEHERQNLVTEEEDTSDSKRFFGPDEVSVASALLLLRADEITSLDSPTSTVTIVEDETAWMGECLYRLVQGISTALDEPKHEVIPRFFS